MNADGNGGRLLLAVEATPSTMVDALRRAWSGGPAVLPLDPRLPARARGRLVHDLKPGAIVRPGGVVSLPGGESVPDDVLAVVPTSGSTGAPKGVMLTKASLTASVRLGLDRTGSDPDAPWLCCLPTSHVGGILVLLRAVVTGTPAVLHDGFDPAAVAAEPGPVHLAVVPTMLRRILDAGGDPGRWGTVLVGGAHAPAELLGRVPGAVSTYGMTETAGGCVYDGWPLQGVRVDTTAEGRLRIAGPTVMRGYRVPVPAASAPGSSERVSPNRPPAAAGRHTPGFGLSGGAFVTNDVGEVDADGRVTVLGRADDVIVTGGEKVVAAQVARRLAEHPAVAEAEVVARPDPEWGHVAVAVVVPAEAGAVLSLALLRSFVADAMPRYAAPQDLVVVNALPRLPGGKVDRVALRGAVAG